ncbi:MAG TPA: hypothetical protein PLK33_05120, partial [bacterium]|nr:hypothetical protein [bacterium]
DYVTADQLADYVTFDVLADYVTVDQLADYVTFDVLADYVTVDQLADYVTVDQLADYVTVDQLVDYVTVDQLADYVTVDQLADYVTVDQLADYVTVDQLADYVTVDQLADYVTFDVLADYVTVDQLADYVTVDQLADYVTVDQLADYVTVDQLADYVTVDQLADYVTFDVLADYVTFDDLANYVTVDVLADYVTFDDLTNYVTTDDFDALMTLVADLSDQLEAMGVDVGDLKDRVGALEDAVANLKMATPENVAELSAKVADLEKKVDSNAAAVSSLLEKKLTYSITTNLTLRSNYKLGDTTQEPTYGTSTANFLSKAALASLSDLPGVVSYLPVDVSTPATGNVAKVTDLPGTGMTAAGNLTLTLDVSKKSDTGNFSAYVDLTLGKGISDFYDMPTGADLSVSSFKIYAKDQKFTAEAGDLTAFKYTDLILNNGKLFLDVNGAPITQRGLTLTYNLSDNVSLTTSIVYLNNDNYGIIYGLVDGKFYSYGGTWYEIVGNQNLVSDVADTVASNMNTGGDYYYDLTTNQWYQVNKVKDPTPGTADTNDIAVSGFQPVWANRLSMKFGDSSFNLNLVKEKTNEIVGGTDLTFKVGNITVGGEYAVAMDRNFAALGGDAAAMKLNLSIPLSSIITVNAGYKDIGADYSATWGSYTADRTGYNAGATLNLGTFTVVGGYAAEKSKSDSSVNNTAYGVGLKTNILGTAVQYTKVSGTDPSELVELSLAPVSIFKLATKYDVGASTWDGLSAEIAIPNLPAVTAYYTPNGTFNYGVAILSDATIADFLTLKAQIDSDPDTNRSQSFVDAKVKLTDNVSLIGAHYSYTNGQTAWAAGVNYSYNWSDNADLSVTLKHLEDPFDTPADVFSASVSTKF